MSAFTLLGKVGLDTTGFTRGLAGMKNAAGPASKQIGDQFKGALMGAIGAGAIVGLFKSTLQKAYEIRRESGRMGIDTDEYQTLKMVADQTGESLDSLAEKLRKSKLEGSGFADEVGRAASELRGLNETLTANQVEELARAQEKINKLGTKVAPGVGALADVASFIHSMGVRFFERQVGTFMAGGGLLLGKPEFRQAGADMFFGREDPTDNAPPEGKSAIQELRDKIAEERAFNQWWKDIGGEEASKGGKESKPSIAAFSPSVSGMTQVGGYMSGAALTRRTVDKDVTDIKRSVDALVSLTRQKE